MKRRTIDGGHGLHVVAAAVLVALGTSYAGAQQPGQPEAEPPQPSQSQQETQPFESQSQDSASQEQSASAQSESLGGSGQLDQLAQQHEDLSTFIEAVKAAGMEESLTGGTEYTVFAPTNEAWEEMSGLSMEELMQPENREQLISLLRAHIVADDVDEQLASSLQEAQTIDGGSVRLSMTDDTLMVGDASVVEPGIQEGSLRVYAIDQVLEPTAVARAEPGSASESESDSASESESPLDTESDQGSPFETESDQGSPLDTESDRGSPLDTESDIGSPLDPESQREPSPLEQN